MANHHTPGATRWEISAEWVGDATVAVSARIRHYGLNVLGVLAAGIAVVALTAVFRQAGANWAAVVTLFSGLPGTAMVALWRWMDG